MKTKKNPIFKKVVFEIESNLNDVILKFLDIQYEIWKKFVPKILTPRRNYKKFAPLKWSEKS